jgi:protocatechuate 3,4-dioxygenase beta subunit
VTIYGKVTDLYGTAVSGAAVGPIMPHYMLKQAETDNDGYYKLKNIKKGELVLSVFHSKYSPFIETFQIEEQQTERRINIKLENPKPLHGRVVDKQGNGIEGVKVRIQEVDGISHIYPYQEQHTTDSQGRFVIDNAPSKGKLRLRIDSDEISDKTVDIDSSKQENIIEVDMGGEIYGRVIDDSTGESVSKFNVRLKSTRKGKNSKGGYSTTWSEEGHNFDDPNGFFDTGNERLPVDANYAVIVYAKGYDLLIADPVKVQVGSNEPDRYIFRLKPAVVVGGKVIDSNGRVIQGATVRWFSEENTLHLNDEHHWSEIDTTITDVNGMFSFEAIGTGTRGVYVIADGYAPNIISKITIPDDADKLSRIVLEKEAMVFGTVFEGERPQAEAEITCDLYNYYDLDRMGYINKRTFTDTQGNYIFSGLPAGQITFRLMSLVIDRTSYTLASKKVVLKPGDEIKLDFGNEGQYSVAGRVKMEQSFLSRAQISFNKDGAYKSAISDEEGFFKISGLEKGSYEVHTRYTLPSDSDSKDARFSADSITDERQIELDSDMDILIAFSDASVSGKIPREDSGKQDTYTVVAAKRWEEKEQGIPGFLTFKTFWQSEGHNRPDANGNFEIKNLKPGKYYLALHNANRLQALSEIFELKDSQQINDVELEVPTGKLRVNIVDADDNQPLAAALCSLYNKDLEIQFIGRIEGYPQSYCTDVNGLIEYENLPQGNYMLISGKKGYLSGEKEIEIGDGESAEMQMLFDKSAIVKFELAQEVNEMLTEPVACIYCKSTNIETSEVYTIRTHYGRIDKQVVYLKGVKYYPETQAPDYSIGIPSGKYRIEYELLQYSEMSGDSKREQPFLTGRVEVDAKAGETTQVIIKKD